MAERNDVTGPLLDARFLLALILLIVNDQFLKAAYGNWVTGKLSDLAGLVVLPVLVGVVLGAFGLHRRVAAACMTVGAWFAAMKLSPWVAEQTELVLEAVTARPSTIVVDPTDLVGLAGLVVAASVLYRPRPVFTRRQVGYVSLAVASLACVASSGPEFYDTDLGVDQTGEVVERQQDQFAADYDESQARAADVEGFYEFATEACLDEANGEDCFRIIDGRVERQTGNGDWELEWAAFDLPVVALDAHGGWGPSIAAKDIVAADDGTIHVGFFDDFGPIVRSADGTWSPPASQFRPLGWLALICVGLVFAAVAMATRVPNVSAITFVLAVLGGLAVVSSWVFGLAGLELLVAFALIGCAAISGLMAVILAIRRRARLNWRRLAVAAAGLAIGLVPALIWKYVVASPSWLYSIAPIPMVLGVAAGFFVRHAPPPPPASPSAGSGGDVAKVSD